MASIEHRLSRKMRVGLLGSTAALGSYGFQFVFDDDYVSSTLGGAVGAIVGNAFPMIRFEGLARVAIVGAIAGYTGTLLTKRLAGDLTDEDDVPFRALVGLVLGGGAGALSVDGILPPEIKLLG